MAKHLGIHCPKHFGKRIPAHWTAGRISAELQAPIILNGDLTLDALMSYVVFQKQGVMRQEAHDRVPIARIGIGGTEIPAASGLQFDGSVAFGKTTIGRSLRRNEVNEQAFFTEKSRKRFGDHVDHWHVNQKSGPYLALMPNYRTFYAHSIFWDVIGDLSWIAVALSGLYAIGKRRGQGYGALGQVSVTPLTLTCPTDIFVSPRKTPTRNLPTDTWQTLGQTLSGQKIDEVAIAHPVWAESALARCVIADPFASFPNYADRGVAAPQEV